MGHNWRLDYERWTKKGFLLGFSMVVLGALIVGLGPRVFGSLPEWELTLAADMIIAGIGIDFIAVFGFGILLPLTE